MLALPIINHLIQQNPETQAALVGYNGIVLTLNIAGLSIRGQFNEQGFLSETNREADTILTFHQSAVQKIMRKEMPGVGDFEIEGDQELGFNLLPLLGGLRYYANDDLSRIFGDGVAGSIATRTRKIGATLKQIGQSLMEQASDYAKEPEAPVITREEFDEWADEVDRLRDDVARLHARLDKFERDDW
ncbi:MAG: SCP2 domain-containing protein [Neisseria sp.]|uniref:ubiquinone biosynthesis accessory factor UbiJ n=1 Tax=Neisseria sp. TaxID=192066 RepID=UPI0026DCB392|nr:SCP2 domain-containing protein [Neisseria sp.]MDO4641131.1 SCP2 domain-containing protein [Neisseria sp.]